MTSVKAFVNRHLIPAYFALTFAVSWGGVLLAMGMLGGIPHTREQFETLRLFAIAAMLVGPSAAALVLTALIDGTSGVRALLSRLRRWRLPARWYAVAVLTAPVVLTAVLLALSLSSNAFRPGLMASDAKSSLLLFGITVGIAVGFLEELGWTGFAVPRLLRRFSVLQTGLIVGFLWGAWHVLPHAVMASGTYSGALSLPVFLTARGVGLLAGGLPAFRVLMVYVYDRTGSLPLAMLMHVSLTASTLILEPLGISGSALFISDLVSGLVWWGVVALVALASGGQLSRQPQRRRAA